MSLETYLKKKKRKKDSENIDVKSFVVSHTEEITNKLFESLKAKIKTEVKDIISAEVDNNKQARSKILDMQLGVRNGKDGESIAGEKGEKGERGESGKSIVGQKGDTGERGERGESVAGLSGKDGEDGSPDTGLEIIEKLNPLDEVLNIEVIKGLKNLIKNLGTSIQDVKRVAKTGGGGSGNVQHETFKVGSTTTSVTVSQGIAGGGFAIWSHLDGQLIMRGEHYNVSGKTLTFTFTPEDDSIVDIIYMRG